MDSSSNKSAKKYSKANSNYGVPSTARGAVRDSSPLQSSRNHYGSRDDVKERSSDKHKVVLKPQAKENTKLQDFKLHTQERAVKRALFNYSVATKIYLMERQKKQILKFQKMIEDEEVRLMRKEMIPRAQLMPYFDRPFFPQRSTRPLTVPKEPNLLSGKCPSSISCRITNFPILHTMKAIK